MRDPEACGCIAFCPMGDLYSPAERICRKSGSFEADARDPEARVTPRPDRRLTIEESYCSSVVCTRSAWALVICDYSLCLGFIFPGDMASGPAVSMVQRCGVNLRVEIHSIMLIIYVYECFQRSANVIMKISA